MKDLGADAAARDAARITRIAGSLNSKSETRVAYWIQKDKKGVTPSYTIDGLLETLGLKEIPSPIQEKRIECKAQEKRKRGQGYAARWEKSLECFEILWALRETWKVGSRNNAAWIYCNILTKLHSAEEYRGKMTGGDRWERMLHLLASFEQPPDDKFSKGDLAHAMNGVGRKTGHIRNQTMSDMLDVTIEESNLLQSAGGGWPPATKYRDGIPRAKEDVDNLSNQQLRQIRHLLLMELNIERKKKKEKLPTLDSICDYLKEQSYPSSPATVAKDLKYLGINNPRRHGRRSKPKKNPQQKLFG